MENQTVPLNKLSVDPLNVRTSQEDGAIKTLAANILACGLINPLTVRKSKKSITVLAGGRRFAALKLLADTGDVEQDTPVPVVVHKGTKEAAIQVSLAENAIRENMNAADEYVAFAAMYKNGKGVTINDIADAYNVTPKRVSALVRLGTLPDAAIQGLRDGSLTVSFLQELANCGCQDRINSALVRLAEGEPCWKVRDLLKVNEIRGGNALVTFVGDEAYKEAGGTIRADLFSDQDSIIYEDENLIHQLAEQKLIALGEQKQAEGWQNVRVYSINESIDTWKLRSAQAQTIEYSEADKQVQEKTQQALETAEENYRANDESDNYDADADAKFSKEIEEYEVLLEGLEEKYTVYSDDQKATCTLHVFFTHYAGANTFVSTPKSKSKDGGADQPVSQVNKAQTERLITTANAAVKQETFVNPKAAKVMLIANHFIGVTVRAHTPLWVANSNKVHFGDDELQAVQPYKQSRDAILSGLNLDKLNEGCSSDEIFEKLMSLSTNELDQLIAIFVADHINLSGYAENYPCLAKSTPAVMTLLDMKFDDHYTVDEATLKAMSAAAIVGAVETTKNQEAISLVKTAKTKKDKIKVALPCLIEAGWMPDTFTC